MSGGSTATFAYDPLGRRTSKTINGTSAQFFYDGNDITAEIGGGTVGANYLRSLNIDEPFIRQAATGNEHYHTDALGSSLVLSNSSGGSANSYTYEPFGKAAQASDASTNSSQFTGRDYDGTDLYYYRARYYNSKRQRFISEDPLRASGDLNYYTYVSNAPLGLVDPFGLYESDVHKDLTACLAKRAGLSDAASNFLGAVNQGVDDRRTTSPFNSSQSRRDWHFTTPGRRADLRQAALGGSLDALGMYLHALQDSYSHAGFDPDWGHAKAGHSPDKTYLDPDKANAMARDTYDAIRQWIEVKTGLPQADEWADLAGMVDRFNRARTSHEKKKFLCQ